MLIIQSFLTVLIANAHTQNRPARDFFKTASTKSNSLKNFVMHMHKTSVPLKQLSVLIG